MSILLVLPQRIQIRKEMSRVQQSTVRSNTYCKICKDAGKSEKVYLNHNIRSLPDLYGKTVVICPILKNTTCNNCSETGHMTKYCPVTKWNNYVDRKSQYEQTQTSQKTVAATPKKTSGGRFAAFESSSDEEDKKKVVKKKVVKKTKPAVVEDFPALPPPACLLYTSPSPRD